MHRLCILVSGGGTTLQSIIDAIDVQRLDAEISQVISSRPGVLALERARKHSIPAAVLDYKAMGGDAYDAELYRMLELVSPDLVCLAGYLRILDRRTVDRFSGRILNIHPALLPDFGGRGMYGLRVHRAVLESGMKESGCTVHFVTEGVDAGPVILQKKVPVLPGDSPESLAERVHVAELETYPKAIAMVLAKMDGA